MNCEKYIGLDLHQASRDPRRFLKRNVATGRRAKAQVCTACMYVFEESDRGVIPMHHSNTDGFPAAEDEEGRLRIKENPFPDT